MKICLINNLYKPYNRGGAEDVVELMAKGLEKKGHKVFLITTRPYFNKFSIFNFQFSIYYINSIYFDLNKLPLFLRTFWHVIDMFDIGSYLKVKSILKREKPDLVITHNLKGTSFLIPLAINNLKIKWLHYLHDIQLIYPSGLMIHGREKAADSFFAKIYTNICRWLFDSPDTVISPSGWLLKLHLEKGFFKNSRQEVLANPWISPNLKQPDSQEKRSNTFDFIYVGQIEEHKGILFLIECFKKFLSESGECRLVVVGAGSKINQAKNLSGGFENIKIREIKDRKEIQKFMLQSDCLIVPSLCYENSPMVIYWAASLGLPVIASASGGVIELIDTVGGVLFQPNNRDDLINKLKWAMENRVEFKKIGKKSQEKITQFSLENFIKKLLDIIK